MPSFRDFAHVGILCTFSNITAAGIARSSQLSSSLAGQAVQYVMAGGTALQAQYKSARQRRVIYLRPAASVVTAF
jgi:hypothetical protein